MMGEIFAHPSVVCGLMMGAVVGVIPEASPPVTLNVPPPVPKKRNPSGDIHLIAFCCLEPNV